MKINYDKIANTLYLSKRRTKNVISETNLDGFIIKKSKGMFVGLTVVNFKEEDVPLIQEYFPNFKMEYINEIN